MALLQRPWVYGLAIGGKLGARDALRGLLAVSTPSLLPQLTPSNPS